MKLRDKKTGEIWTLINRNEGTSAVIWVTNGSHTQRIESIEELTSRFEDYEEPKEFWFVDSGGEVEEATYLTDNDKSSLRNFGNYFETKEEAEKAVEKLKAWKRLKDKGFKITLRCIKGYAYLEANWGNLEGDYSDVLLLFGGKI